MEALRLSALKRFVLKLLMLKVLKDLLKGEGALQNPVNS